MAKPLVVVESPAKAKTISKFLGSAFDVRASVGHVADLPSKGLAVDVDNGFKPTYELTERGKQVVKDLRAALKDASELYLATDEDREGEAISWHLLEHLKPKVPGEADGVPRDHQGRHRPRREQPARHRLRPRRRRRDPAHPRPPVRLRGVAGAVAAGQPRPVGRPGAEPVDPPHRRARAGADRLRLRRLLGHRADDGHRAAVHATLVAVDGTRVATGKDFDAAGPAARQRRRPRRGHGARRSPTASTAPTFTVRSVEEKPYRSSPKPPFMTSRCSRRAGASCGCRRRR